MLYKKNQTSSLDPKLFQNPTSEYRGTPFWAWNCKVSKEDVDRTLNALKKMGMGGAHIHSRTGMDLPYLGKEFMEMVHYSHEKSNELGMITWLYDEDRWPSGYAGGLVTKDPAFRQRFLLFSPEELPLHEEVKAEGRLLRKSHHLGVPWQIRHPPGKRLSDQVPPPLRGSSGARRL